MVLNMTIRLALYSKKEILLPENDAYLLYLLLLKYHLVSNVLNQKKSNLILNVNFPSKIKQFNGIKICRQAKGYWQDTYDKRTSPLGKEYYWLTGSFINQDNSEETDEWALEKGYVSVVPISYDMTSHDDLDELKKWKFN